VPAAGIFYSVAAANGQAMITEYLECRTNGSFKFWEVTYPAPGGSECWWEVRWGRIGTDGQKKRHPQTSAEMARGKAKGLRDEKESKGYTAVGGYLSSSGSPPANAQGLSGGLGPATQKTPVQSQQLTDLDRDMIVALRAKGYASKAIAARLGFTVQQVAAVQAHQTMGTCAQLPQRDANGLPIPDQSGLGPVITPPGDACCGRCGGTGRFRRRHGKIETCIVCKGSGADKTAQAAMTTGVRSFAALDD
jgi:predicted DNA-binding WGR domain protein